MSEADLRKAELKRRVTTLLEEANNRYEKYQTRTGYSEQEKRECLLLSSGNKGAYEKVLKIIEEVL